MSIHVRRFIERVFGWGKTTGPWRKTHFRGRARVGMAFLFGLAVYDLVPENAARGAGGMSAPRQRVQRSRMRPTRGRAEASRASRTKRGAVMATSTHRISAASKGRPGLCAGRSTRQRLPPNGSEWAQAPPVRPPFAGNLAGSS